MRQLESKPPLQKVKQIAKLSTTCVACRARHLKCSGGKPSCVRCTKQGISCLFEPSRQGQRNPPSRTPNPTPTPPTISTTCTNCRERHLKCSGGPSCARCGWQGISCVFQQSRRGYVYRSMCDNIDLPIIRLFFMPSALDICSCIVPDMVQHSFVPSNTRTLRNPSLIKWFVTRSASDGHES